MSCSGRPDSPDRLEVEHGSLAKHAAGGLPPVALQASGTVVTRACGYPDKSAGCSRGGHAPDDGQAHAGDPLNEAADALASAAAELDSSRPQEVDQEGVYFRYKGPLVPWNSDYDAS